MITNRSGSAEERERMGAYRRLQSEFLAVGQDVRKKKRNREVLVAEIRKLKSDITRMETALRDKTMEEARLSRDLGNLEAEESRIRRRMNLMT